MGHSDGDGGRGLKEGWAIVADMWGGEKFEVRWAIVMKMGGRV